MTLDQDTPSNILVANIIKDKQVSIAMTEHGSTVIRVASFKDDSNFSLLSSVAAAHSTVLSNVSLPFVSTVLSSDFTPLPLITVNQLTGTLNSLSPLICAPLNALCSHLSLLSSDLMGLFTILQVNFQDYCTLDQGAIKALSISHLYKLLDKCSTAIGSRLLNTWLLMPLKDKSHIESRLDIVQVLTEDPVLLQQLSSILKNFPDIERTATKFTRSKANLNDCVALYQALNKIPMIIQVLESCSFESEFQQIAEPLMLYNQDLQKLCEMIESTIDFSGIDAIIKPELDQDLIKLQELVSSTEEEILDEINSIYKKLDMDEKKLKREFNTTYGHHLRVPRADSKSIKNYIELSTLKSGILFTSVGLKRLNNQLKENQESYNKKSSAVIKEVLGIVSTYVPVIEKISSVIGKLDVLMSFATCGNHAPSPYVRPTFNDDKRICLKECRHALIEGLSQFIPNNVEMIGGSSNFQVITGPNCGGKSTYIRQVGICMLLAQIGCFVPAESADLTIVDSILARVGAGDIAQQAFMAEMLEISSILKQATPNSLVIVDEIGRGTSTRDGFALAYSIAEHVAGQGCFSLFATHFHELIVLSEKMDCVVNKHVKVVVNDQELTLLYKVEDGACLKSFGIQVAGLAKFPERVTRVAKRKVDELEGCYVANKDGELFINEKMNELKSIELNGMQDRELMTGIEEILLNGSAGLEGFLQSI